MNNMRKGLIISMVLHSSLLMPFLVPADIFSDVQQDTLDIGFSFRLEPLGNTLERSAKKKNVPPQLMKKNQNSNAPGSESDTSVNKTAERYGTAGGSEDVEEFYISENFRSIMAIVGNRLIYPSMARENGWQGKVLVSFIVDTDGKIKNVKVKASSGFPLLDSSAVKTVQSITGIPAPSRPVRITLPISFRLD